MITRLNFDCIATVYPYECCAFSEAYSAFDDKSPDIFVAR